MKLTTKFSRTSAHRKRMMRNLTTQVLRHKRVKTTEKKAKEVRRHVDHVINLSKTGTLHARRQALAICTDNDVVAEVFRTYPEMTAGRTSGYTRLYHAGTRKGDRAPMMILEIVDSK